MLNSNLIELGFIAASNSEWVMDNMPKNVNTMQELRNLLDRVDFIQAAITMLKLNDRIDLEVEIGQTVILRFDHRTLNDKSGVEIVLKNGLGEEIGYYQPNDTKGLERDIHQLLSFEESVNMWLWLGDDTLIASHKETASCPSLDLNKRIRRQLKKNKAEGLKVE